MGLPMMTHLFQNGPGWPLFLSTFALIFLAELPDKTALAVLFLADRHRPLAVYAGVCLAFMVQNIVAVFCGSLLGLLPVYFVHMGSGVLFLVFAALMLVKRGKDVEPPGMDAKGGFLEILWRAFMVIFIAEWGDLTQLATAALVAQTHNPLTIFTASTLALWVAGGLFVILGHYAKKVIRPYALQTIAALAFAVAGALLLTGLWDK